MKRLIAIVLLLALPAVAVAADSVSLLVGGSNSITVTRGQLITMDVSVVGTTAFYSLDSQITASADDIFSVQASWNPQKFGSGTEEDPYVGGIDNGWTWLVTQIGTSTAGGVVPYWFDEPSFDPANEEPLPLPVQLGTQSFYDNISVYPNAGFYRASTAANFPTTGWARNMLEIPVTVALDAANGIYTLSPGSKFTNIGGINLTGTSGNDLTIDIVPEPATMLLLAGVVPFLRRRRA